MRAMSCTPTHHASGGLFITTHDGATLFKRIKAKTGPTGSPGQPGRWDKSRVDNIKVLKSAKKDKPQAVHKYQTYGQTHTKARGTCQSSHIPEHVPMQPCRITSQLCEILPDGNLSADRPTVKTTSQCQTS